MPIQFRCSNPACRQPFTCPDKMAGQKARCPKCQTVNQVPASAAAAASGGQIRLGPYKVVRKIGEGKMGAVYEAVQEGSNLRVALKVLPQRMMGDAHSLERFQREANAAAGLKHPNVIAAYEIGRDKGYVFFSMEYIDGENLKERVKREGKIRASEALGIIRHVAQAMDHAWNHGKIIHRDLKPDNIMLTREGQVKVADLGLAKSTEIVTEVTAPGTAIGSPEYMAPEQFTNARDVDCRADVYSLGITLFIMLTGRRPYQAKTAIEYLALHRDVLFPDPRELEPEVPESVHRLLQRMCAKKPEERFQTPRELLSEVERLLGMPAASPAAQPESAVASSDELTLAVTPAAGTVSPSHAPSPPEAAASALPPPAPPSAATPVGAPKPSASPAPAPASAGEVTPPASSPAAGVIDASQETRTWVETGGADRLARQRRRKRLLLAALVLAAVLAAAALYFVLRFKA
ncbi:MAG: protein kinase [Planctomycetes bacterium]|nr:protein kinase [Planctomycetota bacterium]